VQGTFMLKQTRTIALAGLCVFAIGPVFGANYIDGKGLPATGPTATAKVLEANYCFAEAHGISPERLPAPPLVLRVRLQVSYHDSGNRPLIVPLDHDLTVWMSQGPGVMKILHQPAGIFDRVVKTMIHLPPDVSPDSPVDPKNDVFGVIPAGRDMTAPQVEEVTLQVYKKSLRQRIDLRGRRVYLKLQLDHQPVAASLEAEMSDRWSRFGVPWTGGLRTNTVILDIPSTPHARECPDNAAPHSARQRL
jgi:hypothetical protein